MSLGQSSLDSMVNQTQTLIRSQNLATLILLSAYWQMILNLTVFLKKFKEILNIR